MELDERYYKKLKATYLVFKEKRTQQEVAKLLGISRPTLTKFIEEAIAEGILKIEVVDVKEVTYLFELEGKIRRKFDMKDVNVVDCISDKHEEITESLGRASAKYFESILKSNMKIGISWGSTLASFVSHLKVNHNIKNLDIAALVGGSFYMNTNYHSNILVHRMLEKYSGREHFLYAPNHIRDPKLYKMLMQNEDIKHTLEIGKQCDIAIVGIGGYFSPDSRISTFTPYVQDQTAVFENKTIVGGINAQFLGEKGELLDIKVQGLSIGVKLGDFKKINRTMAIAGGEIKHKAILATLRGKYINTLITDKFTAEYLLKNAE